MTELEELQARVAGLQAELARVQHQLQQTQQALAHEAEKRASDRAGRIRAEQEVRQLQMQLVTLQADSPNTLVPAQDTQPQPAGDARHAASDGLPNSSSSTSHRPRHSQAQSLPAYPFRPIGFVQSCFTRRNGTPRQPHLVPAARAQVELTPDIPDACLEGLTHFSHCWVLFVFHENTDLAKVLSPQRGSGIKAKINVPRLSGGRLGVLATRSPHRPCPIGLSVAQVLGVQGRKLLLGGVDVVDGSPVLDIKPYVPFCDSVPDARAPSWVASEAEDEPLRVAGVVMEESVKEQIRRAWKQVRSTSLYSNGEDFLSLVEQVLGRDIRSLHQRSQQPVQNPTGPPSAHEQCQSQAGEPGAAGSGCDETGAQLGVYHVVLDGVDISYDLSASGQVTVVSARTHQPAGGHSP